jgi:hypothetical protein
MLTPEQQEQIRKATGKLTDTLQLSIEELEERIAPGYRAAGATCGHRSPARAERQSQHRGDTRAGVWR